MAIFRPVLALILGAVVFFGFLLLIFYDNVSGKLLDADFYADTISGEDAYNRVYDEVLVDEALANTTQALLGDLEVISQAEAVELLREILPPSYLQSQVEGSIQRTVGYLKEERQQLDVYLELGPPLENVRPVLFAYLDQRIDALELEQLGPAECTGDRINDVAQRYRTRWEELASGRVPASIPSVENLTPVCRALIFDLAFSSLVAGSGLEQRAKASLQEAEPDIEREFVVEGDTHGMLKVAARPLADPLIDDAVLRIREQLEPQDRVDLIHQLALWNDAISEMELRQRVGTVRGQLASLRKFDRLAAWPMVVGGSILLVLLFWPRLRDGLRWAGLTLLLTGLVIFIGGKVLESQVPYRLSELAEWGNQAATIPPSVTALCSDLLVAFGKGLTEGIAGSALIPLAVGAVLFAGSIVAGYLGLPLFIVRSGGLLLRPFTRIIRRPQ